MKKWTAAMAVTEEAASEKAVMAVLKKRNRHHILR